LTELRQKYGDRFRNRLTESTLEANGLAGKTDRQLAESMRKSILRHAFEKGVSTEPVEVSLRYTKGMSRIEFVRKAQSLEDLGKQGLLFKAPYKTNVMRDKSITQGYRQDMIDRIWSQYSSTNKEFATALVRRVTKQMQPDHVWELQLLGPDSVDNLRFLHSETNRMIGMHQINPQIQHLRPGTPIRITWSLQ